MKEFMTSISQIGGYIDKKSQGPPGTCHLYFGHNRHLKY